MNERMRDFDRWRARRQRFAVLRAIMAWALLLLAAAFTALGVWVAMAFLLAMAVR